MEAVTDFIFFGSKITADRDYSHGIKRRLFLGRKAMTNLDSILKSRDFKVCLVKAMVSPGVMNGCVRVGPERSLSTEELMLPNHGAGEVSIKQVNPKGNQP